MAKKTTRQMTPAQRAKFKRQVSGKGSLTAAALRKNKEVIKRAKEKIAGDVRLADAVLRGKGFGYTGPRVKRGAPKPAKRKKK